MQCKRILQYKSEVSHGAVCQWHVPGAVDAVWTDCNLVLAYIRNIDESGRLFGHSKEEDCLQNVPACDFFQHGEVDKQIFVLKRASCKL